MFSAFCSFTSGFTSCCTLFLISIHFLILKHHVVYFIYWLILCILFLTLSLYFQNFLAFSFHLICYSLRCHVNRAATVNIPHPPSNLTEAALQEKKAQRLKREAEVCLQIHWHAYPQISVFVIKQTLVFAQTTIPIFTSADISICHNTNTSICHNSYTDLHIHKYQYFLWQLSELVSIIWW